MNKLCALGMVGGMLFALTGCAQYVWIKANATPQDLGKDKYACLQSAAMTAPVVPVLQADSTKSANPKHYDSNASVYTTDLNQNTRDQLFSACMESRGWSLQLVKANER